LESFEQDLHELDEHLAQHPPPAKPVVFYGSSSIRMWDTLEADFPDAKVTNCGFGGSTMEACAAFFERIVAPLSPSAMVMYAGDNDLWDGNTPAFVEEQLRSLLGKLDTSFGDVPLLLLNVKPSPTRLSMRDRMEETNQRFVSVCAERPHTRVLDIFTPMLRHGEPRYELYLEDGIHLSRAGYALWTELVQGARGGIF